MVDEDQEVSGCAALFLETEQGTSVIQLELTKHTWACFIEATWSIIRTYGSLKAIG